VYQRASRPSPRATARRSCHETRGPARSGRRSSAVVNLPTARTGRKSWWSAGPSRNAAGQGSARCCSLLRAGRAPRLCRSGRWHQYRRVERLGRRLQPLAASDMPLEVLSAQVPMVEAQQLGGSGGSRLARNESFIDFGQHPVFGIITFLEDNRRPSNFSPQAAREARSERPILSSCKIGSKVEAIPCFNFALPKKLHLFRDARS
jgi:hypothetical protein